MTRHLDHLSRIHGREKVEALLERAALLRIGARLTSRSGGDVGPAECTQYLLAVKEVLGDAEYLPARVNFVLARCSCMAS